MKLLVVHGHEWWTCGKGCETVYGLKVGEPDTPPAYLSDCPVSVSPGAHRDRDSWVVVVKAADGEVLFRDPMRGRDRALLWGLTTWQTGKAPW